MISAVWGKLFGPVIQVYRPRHIWTPISRSRFAHFMQPTRSRLLMWCGCTKVAQLPQTSYQALQTPYSFFGLGRTNNYIENLFVGSTKHQPQHYINMEGVIPNSKVVIIPPIGRDGDWRRELYLRPGEWIPWVTLTVVVATVVLAIIVFVLHLNEKVRWKTFRD